MIKSYLFIYFTLEKKELRGNLSIEYLQNISSGRRSEKKIKSRIWQDKKPLL